MADLTDVTWNQEARDKMLTDADRVLQDAVREGRSARATT